LCTADRELIIAACCGGLRVGSYGARIASGIAQYPRAERVRRARYVDGLPICATVARNIANTGSYVPYSAIRVVHV